jgi:endonuclease YncB( thermonuclease family)
MLTLALTLLCAACAPAPEPVPLAARCSVTDGDTIRCGDERIRLLAIDAPELPGHCRAGRACAPGDPFAATRALEAAIAFHRLTVQRFGRDRYGRTLAIVRADGANLSCRQIASGSAVYVAKWDKRGIVGRECGAIRIRPSSR